MLSNVTGGEGRVSERGSSMGEGALWVQTDRLTGEIPGKVPK